MNKSILWVYKKKTRQGDTRHGMDEPEDSGEKIKIWVCEIYFILFYLFELFISQKSHS